MRSMKLIGLCFIAVLALSAVVSTSASAKNPRWVVETKPGETKELKTGETKGVEAEANGVQKLSAPEAKTTILCKKLKLKAGAVIIGGEPGTDAETIVYEECSVEGASECKVKGPPTGTWGIIETNRLDSKLAYATSKAEAEENQEHTVTVFYPQTKSTFVEIELWGNGKCPLPLVESKALPITGEVACENTKGGTRQATKELVCPEPVLKAYWEQTPEQTATKRTVSQLKMSVYPATYSGQSYIKMIETLYWWII